VSSKRWLDTSTLCGIGAGGSLAAPVNHTAFLPLSEVWHNRGLRAQKRQWEMIAIFILLPGNSGLFRFLTNRQKYLKPIRCDSYAEMEVEVAAPEDRRRKIPSFSTIIAAQT
jgi:hypothetical protein